APRAVVVHALSLHDWRDDQIELTLRCSRGFYVRALASDLGDALGCGAHVRELRRTAVGAFSLADACTLAQLEAIESPQLRQRLLRPTDQGLAHLPSVHLPPAIAARLRHGQAVAAAFADGQDKHEGQGEDLVRVYADDAFIGLAQCGADGMITPKRLFQPAKAANQTATPSDDVARATE
ncbi:MAG: tRNA pseudouridine(55) synthase TruB, partial [bacterium]